jgi:hypothetical protein
MRNTRSFRITLEELEGERWVLKWLSNIYSNTAPPGRQGETGAPGFPASGFAGQQVGQEVEGRHYGRQGKGFLERG